MSSKVILKLSGEALSSGDGILSYDKLYAVAKEVKELQNQGIEVAIVNGAGNIWRGRDAETLHMERVHADHIGMIGTVINGMALASVLNTNGVKSICLSAVDVPGFVDSYNVEKAKELLNEGYVVVLGGGTGKPFFSTDTTAALRASELGIDTILMAKNGTDGVYDSDPRTNPSAKRFATLKYQEMIDLKLGVMDLAAAKICQDYNIKTVVFDMNKDGNISKVASCYSIGTVVEN